MVMIVIKTMSQQIDNVIDIDLGLGLGIMECVLCQNVKEKTASLWSFVNDQQDIYLNPLYVHSVHQQHVLFPVASLRRIVPWNGYYLRWNPSIIPQVVTEIKQTVTDRLRVHSCLIIL